MEYFLLKSNGEQTGTFSIEQVRAMLNTGFIDAETRYWHEGATEWRPVGQIDESLNFKPPESSTPKTHSTPPKFPPYSRAVPPPGSKLEKARSPTIDPTKAVELPGVFPTSGPTRNEPAIHVEFPDSAERAQPEIVYVEKPRGNRTLRVAFYVFHVTLMALAIDYAVPPALLYVSDLFQAKAPVERKVTLLDGANYVLLDRTKIKPFTDDLQNAPVVAALQKQIAQTNNAATLLRLNVGLTKELARHTDEVEQRYIETGSGEFIDPGTYRLIDYLDDKGNSVTSPNVQPVWTVLSYDDHPVYVFKVPGPTQAAGQPQK